MVNDLIDAISVKLNQVFGNGVRIYSESVKQGLKEPCFFIAVLNPTQSPMIGARYFREHPFDIHYFPSKDGVAAENTYCTAKYKGIRGNDIKIVVATNIDDETKVDVSTYVGTRLVDKQTVLPNTNNLVDNDWVIWKDNVEINPTAGLPLTSGSNWGNQEIQDVASKLFDALEYITLLDGDLVRGTEMHYEKVDDVLHFFVKYNMFVYKQVEKADPMETLTVNNNVKG